MSSDRSDLVSISFEDLSAFADGQLDVAAAARVAAKWRDDDRTRKAWHAYHLIGDVLRSDELSAGARDEVFLQSLRARLAQEPVVLAPAAAAADEPTAMVAEQAVANAGTVRRRRRWGAPVAVAAGFVAVAGALVVTQVGETPATPQGTTLAAAGGASLLPAKAEADGAAPPAASPERVLVVNGELVRDAQLDRYLAAHKQFGGSTALGVPSGFLRSSTHEVPSR